MVINQLIIIKGSIAKQMTKLRAPKNSIGTVVFIAYTVSEIVTNAVAAPACITVSGSYAAVKPPIM